MAHSSILGTGSSALASDVDPTKVSTCEIVPENQILPAILIILLDYIAFQNFFFIEVAASRLDCYIPQT